MDGQWTEHTYVHSFDSTYVRYKTGITVLLSNIPWYVRIETQGFDKTTQSGIVNRIKMLIDKFLFFIVVLFISIIPSHNLQHLALEQNMRNKLRGENSILIIDGDNVRGKTKFSLSKEDVCDRVGAWTIQEGLQGRVIVVFDHSSRHDGYMLSNGVAVVFSGPDYNGDDIIARDSYLLQREFNDSVVIITDDKELQRRCKTDSKRIMKKKNIVLPSILEKTTHFLTSTAFATFLINMDLNLPSSNTSALTSPDATSMSILSTGILTQPKVRNVLTEMSSEIDVKRKLAQVQTLLSTTSRKNKPRALSRVKQMELRLQKIHGSRSQDTLTTLNELALILGVPSVDDKVTFNSSARSLFEARHEILSKVLNLLKYDEKHIEGTWERIILAENFRNELLNRNSSTIECPNSEGSAHLLLQQYVTKLHIKALTVTSKNIPPLVFTST